MNGAVLVVVDAVAAGGILGLCAAAVVGCLLGRMLTASVGRLLASGILDADVTGDGLVVASGSRPPGPSSSWPHRWIELALIIVAVGLWWWEVRLGGQLARGESAGVLDSGSAAVTSLDLVVRWGAHMLLFTLLAAAAWIDIRHRLIPDCVTVPGVLAGLACVWAWPNILLPVACEVPRSFAPPLLEPDVLGLFGGLRTAAGIAWLGPRPHLPGLLVPMAIFTVWWAVCTAPFFERVEYVPDVDRRGTGQGGLEPRNLILLIGLTAIGGAWAVGGDRFVALQSSLAGVLVSAGIVWAVRAGASRALGREAMGLGDVTLMGMVGAWVGWQACLIAFFLAAFIGLGHGVVQVVRHRDNELPYGPSLCLASAAVVIGWRPVWDRVGVYFGEPVELAFVVTGVVALTALTLFCWQRLRPAAASEASEKSR